MSDKANTERIALTSEDIRPSVFVKDMTKVEEYKALLAASLINPDKPEPEPETLLSLSGTPILWRGGKAFVCGVAKSRKTTALTIISAILMGKDETANGFAAAKDIHLLYVDTEQSRADSQRILHRVASLTNRKAAELAFDVLSLNQLNPEQIKGVIEIALQGKGYDVVILDNWTDCVESVMDDKLCTDFSRQLRELAETYKVAILSVIHANESARNDDRPNFRGWGAEEARKSDLTMFLRDMGEYSKATFGRCRGRRPEGFCVSHDADGRPCIYTPTETETSNPDQYAEIVAKIPHTGTSYTGLCKQIKSTAKIAESTAKAWIKRMEVGGAVKKVKGMYYAASNAPKSEEEKLPF